MRESDIGTRAGLFEVVKVGDEFFTFIVDCKVNGHSTAAAAAAVSLPTTLLAISVYVVLNACTIVVPRAGDSCCCPFSPLPLPACLSLSPARSSRH